MTWLETIISAKKDGDKCQQCLRRGGRRVRTLHPAASSTSSHTCINSLFSLASTTISPVNGDSKLPLTWPIHIMHKELTCWHAIKLTLLTLNMNCNCMKTFFSNISGHALWLVIITLLFIHSSTFSKLEKVMNRSYLVFISMCTNNKIRQFTRIANEQAKTQLNINKSPFNYWLQQTTV